VTLKYFVYTQLGSLLILVALDWMVATAGSAHLGTMAARLPLLADQQRTWMVGLLIAGFAIKMAVFPVHGWLPDAHALAPMPVTVMLAAAMLGMGAYGMLRFGGFLLHGDLVVTLRVPLMVLALASQVYGALMCLASRDIKRLIAYSSVSQMGFVLFALGSFSAQGVAGSVLHVVNHGVLKAALFMGVGLIIRGTGRREVAQLGGLVRAMPGVVLGLSVGALAMTGLPPFCAFHSELMIIEGGLASGLPLLAYLELAAPLATTAYAAWLIACLTLGQSDRGLTVMPTPATMRYSFYGLLVLALLLGLSPGMLYQWADGAAAVFGLGD
jgi:NADH-quinone oxidoreductase subunit M